MAVTLEALGSIDSQMKEVTAAIVITDGKALLTRRGPSEKLAGFWEFPGGKVESGESLSDCLRRELKEELCVGSSVRGKVCESVYEYEHGAFRLIALDVDLHSHEFRLSVHDKALWIPIAELLNYKLLPADIPIAESLIARHTEC